MSIPSPKPRIAAVVGPTASGKTALSIEMALRFNGEIVSADSRQIYRGMNIGTAKPSQKELSTVPHHLIDIKDPDKNYTVAEYKRDALAAIDGILKRKRLPILVGGTGLYVRAVLENLPIPEVKADPALRRSLEKEIEEKGLPAVFKKLVELDPEAAYVVDPKNPRRVIRAFEVTTVTGKPFTTQRKKGEPLFDARIFGIDVPSEVLRKRIDLRIDQMMENGLLTEVQSLIKRYGVEQTAFDAIGYRELIEHLSGAMKLEEAIALMKMNTWQYARRQMTWFRKDKNIRWIKNEKGRPFLDAPLW